MKLRIVKIPRWTPTKRPGIMLATINELGFEEKMTFVLQQLVDEVWEDVPVTTERRPRDEAPASSAC